MTVDVSSPSRLQALLTRALSRLRVSAGADITFGGVVDPQSRLLIVTGIDGGRPTGLLGRSVEPGVGIGGQVMKHARPVVVNDRTIMEKVVRSGGALLADDGLSAILAVPVCENGIVRAVLYAALRAARTFDESAIHAAIAVARLMERDMTGTAAEPAPRLPPRPPVARMPASPARALPGESLRLAWAELREVSEQIADPRLRDRIGGVSELLRGLLDEDVPARQGLALTPRELEVLGQVALGLSNVETARRLTVAPETVKAYLRSIMRKLGVNNRTAAVHTARQLGMLP